MLDEITKDIKATLYDRIASPFTGSLIISWIYWNWEIIVVLFFMDNEVLDVPKNEFIRRTLISKWNVLWAPLISASILTVFYPLVSTCAYWVWQQFQSRKRKIKIQSEDKVPLDIEESVELRLQIRRMQQKFQESNEANNLLIDQVTEENSSLKKELAQKRRSAEEVNKIIQSESEKKVEVDRLKRELQMGREDFKELLDQKGMSDKSLKSLQTKYEELQNQLKYLQEVINTLESKKALLKIYKKQGVNSEELKVRELDELDKAGLINLNKSKSVTIVHLSPLGRDIVNILMETIA